MSIAREVIAPDEAARLMIWGGVSSEAIRDDAGLALTLFDILSATGARASRIPEDFQAVRTSYAAIAAGRPLDDLNA